MATKFGQKIALISSLQEIKKFFACTVGISGLVNFSTLSEFLREPRELPWQPYSNKKRQNCTDFSSMQEIEKFFHTKSQVFGSATSNMLSQFSREPRELPWQPNSEKNEPKLHKFAFLARNRRIFRIFSGVLWAS